MIDTFSIYEKLKEKTDPALAEGLAEVLGSVFLQLQESLRERWFQKLDEEITTFRRESDARFARIENALAQLIEVQQRHSEEIAELREAQKHTENTLAQLIQAMQETQQELRRLGSALDDVRKQVGGLAMTVGYGLEDEAYKALPALLAQHYGLQVEGRLKRQYVLDREGNHIEVNIFGQARHNGDAVTIVGESKTQLSRNDVDGFIRRKLQRLQGVYSNLFPVLVTRMTSEWDVEDYARSLGIVVFYSYDF